MWWPFTKKQIKAAALPLAHILQLDRVEKQLQGNAALASQAYIDLDSAITLAISHVASLTATVAGTVAGTSDADLALLTAKLNAALGVVVTPAPAVAAPVVSDIPPATPSVTG